MCSWSPSPDLACTLTAQLLADQKILIVTRKSIFIATRTHPQYRVIDSRSTPFGDEGLWGSRWLVCNPHSYWTHSKCYQSYSLFELKDLLGSILDQSSCWHTLVFEGFNAVPSRATLVADTVVSDVGLMRSIPIRNYLFDMVACSICLFFLCPRHLNTILTHYVYHMYKES